MRRLRRRNVANNVRYVIEVDAAGGIRKIEQLDQTLREVKRTSGETHSIFSQLWRGFVTGQIIVDAIRKGFGLLKAELKETVAQAINAERVDRALESSLSLVTGASSGAAASLKLYASALQRQTIYGDEAIKSAMSLIIQMRGTASRIDEATKGAIGLASVFQMDLQSAARAVAQGMEGNYRSLTQMIPALKTATTESERHAIFMKAMADGYARAKDDAKTFGGQLDTLKEAYSDLQETIGGFLTKNQSVIDTLSGVKEIIIWIDRWAQTQKGDKSSLENALNWTVFGALPLALRKLGGEAKKANEEWEKSWAGHTAAMLAFRKQALDPLPIIIKETLPYVDSLVDRFSRLDDDLRMFRMLGGFEINARIKESFGALGDVIGGALGNVVNFTEKAADGLFDFLGKTVKATDRAVDKQTERWASFFMDIGSGFANAFTQFRLTTEGFKSFFLNVWQAIRDAFFRFVGEMIARWVLFKSIMGVANLLSGGLASALKTAAAPLKFWQEGFHGVVTQPTLAIVGERGPERVDVTPVGTSSSSRGERPVSITFNIHAIDASGVEKFLRHDAYPTLRAMFAHGDL